MTVEVATYIGDLVGANPAAGDPKSEGDDHIRLIKAVLQASLPNLAGRFGRTQAKAANYDLAANDNTSVIVVTAGSVTIGTAVAASSMGNGFFAWIFATNGDVTFSPNGAETVNGATTATIYNGGAALVVCNGSNWWMGLIGNNIYLDSVFRVADETTGYKLSLQLSGLTADRTLTPQDAAGTIALTSEFAFTGLPSTSGRLLYPPKHFGGFVLANNGTTNMDIGAGSAASPISAANIKGSALTKSQNSWVVGGSNGGRFSAAAMANNTWYHWYAIRKDSDGTVDYGFSTNATNPTGDANYPAGYTHYIYIGSTKTQAASTNWESFLQVGNEVFWSTITNDSGAFTTSANTAVNKVVRVPLGVQVMVYWQAEAAIVGTGTNLQFRVYNPSLTDVSLTAGGDARASGGVDNAGGSSTVIVGNGQALSDTNSQLRFITDRATNECQLTAAGWRYLRGN